MGNQIEHSIRSAIAHRPRLTAQCRSLAIELHPDVVVLDGKVATIAAKRQLVLLAARNGGGLGVLDRVRVEAITAREDAEIAIDVLEALARESTFQDYRVRIMPGDSEPTPTPPAADNPSTIEVAVCEGTARLEGTVERLLHRRLAEVLCWWVPGTTNVDNHLYVIPSAPDSDEEITAAVRTALDKDPWLDASLLDVSTEGREVKLAGALPNNEQYQRAESDAWYVRGVHGVMNKIEIESPPAVHRPQS